MKDKYLYIVAGVVALIATYFILKKYNKLPKWLMPGGEETAGSRSLGLQTPYMQGSDVRELQTLLTELYAKGTIDSSPGAVDGVYGPNTSAAHDAALKAYAITARTLKALKTKVAA